MATQTLTEPGVAVADRPANGHPTGLAQDMARPVAEVQPAAAAERPAKIDKLAESAEKRPRRTLRQVLASWRRKRPARRPGVVVADGLDLTRLYPWLSRLVSLVIALTFVLSYHGLFEYGHTIALLPVYLAVAVPVGLDLFSLCSLVATFLCRDAHWRVRAYCWATFGATVALSVAGNAAFAYAEQIRHAHGHQLSAMQYGAIGAAAVWPALAAGALHLLIIARRHVAAVRMAAAVAEVDQAEQEDQREQQRARAIAIWAETGASASDIHEQIGVPARTIDNWLRPVRERFGQGAARRGSAKINGK